MRPRHFSYSHIVPRCTLSSITKNVLSRYNGIRFLNVKFSGPLIFSSHFDQNLFWVSFNRGRKLTKLLPCRSRFTKSQKLLCNVCIFCFPLHYSPIIQVISISPPTLSQLIILINIYGNRLHLRL